MRRIIRVFLSRFFRNRIIKRTIAVENGKNIRWFVSPDSQLKYLKPSFDQELHEFVSRYVSQNDKIWDVGANCGTFSAFCLSQGIKSKIIAIEPDIFLVSLLLRNATNYNLHPICAAVSDSHDFLELRIAENGRASNSISTTKGRNERGGVRTKQPVITITLDHLLNYFGTPDIIKIDIEGAELLAITGGRKLLSKRKTRFLIEIDAENKEGIMEIMLSYGYDVQEIFPENYYFTPK